MGLLTVYRKTVADLASPKVLAAYFVPFLVLNGMLALGSRNDFEAGMTLAQQEATMSTSFAFLSYFLTLGFPFLALVAVFGANTLAKEAEAGTLRILLSKPTRRWKILFATFAAIVTYSLLVALASLLVVAVMLYVFGGAHPATLSAGIFAWLPGSLLYALFGASVVCSLALALAAWTGDRLKTVLGALSIAALHFGFMPARVFAGEERYEDYFLYLFDVNYHFGQAFVFLHRLVGDGFDVETQAQLALPSGVYEPPAEQSDGLPESLDLVEHVSMELSVFLLALVAVVAFVLALRRFQRMDV